MFCWPHQHCGVQWPVDAIFLLFFEQNVPPELRFLRTRLEMLDARLLAALAGRLWYPWRGLMRILFIISVVAILALLWAAISIARHVRKARDRRKRLNEPSRTDASTGGGHKIGEVKSEGDDALLQSAATKNDQWDGLQDESGSAV
jgi:hypothetical protein